MSEEESSVEKQKRKHSYMVRFTDEENDQLIEIGRVLEEEPGAVLLRQIAKQYYNGKNLFKLYNDTAHQVQAQAQELTTVKSELGKIKSELAELKESRKG